MLNKRPIFITAFAYGGSNILLNLLRSHPDVCSPRGELNEVFKGRLEEPMRTRIVKMLRYLPCMLAEGRDIFRFNSWEPRRPFKSFTQKQVDKILFDDKLRATGTNQNKYKSENELYTKEEIAQARLLSKNLDGLILCSIEFSRMYPDAVFFGLVRNGYAVSEGHLRRGHKVEKIAKHYDVGCKQMLEDVKRIPNYHIIKYEDIIADPLASLKKIYQLAGLDIGKVKKVRLEAKKVIEADGSHQVVQKRGWKDLVWYPLEEFPKHFRADANENQIKRLTQEQKDAITRLAEPSLRHFGYL